MTSAAGVFLATRFVWGLAFYMMVTVSMIYQVQMAGLGPLQLVLVGTAMEVSAFLFEVPTGLVADRWSRKWSVIVGFFTIGVSFVITASFPLFWVIALGSALFGLGWTFVSGAHQAWIADETSVAEAATLYVKGGRLANVGALVGIVIAMALGSLQVNYPYLLSGVIFCGWALALVTLMRETGFSPAASTATGWQLAGLREGIRVVRGSPTLLMLMVTGVVIGTFSEGYDRLNTAHLLRSFEFPAPLGLEPVVLFGVFAILSNLAGVALLWFVERRLDTSMVRQVALGLALCNGLILAGVAIFALTTWVWLAIAIVVLVMPLRQAVEPLTTGWLNQHVASEVRATVISMHGQSDALGQMAGGPGVGLLASLAGMRSALFTSAILLAPAVWLFFRSRTLEAGPLPGEGGH